MNTQKRSQSDTSKAITISIDWISTTNHVIPDNLSYSSYPLLHDWENWQTTNGANGYSVGAKHTVGVKAYFAPNRPDMGVHTIYSSTALRRIQEMNGDTGIDVLRYHVAQGHNIARLDIALDFIGCGLTVQNFQDVFTAGIVKTRLKTASTVQSLTHAGHTLYLGSRKKRKKLVRVYDKAAEQGIEGDWVRVEIQVMGKPATVASQTIVQSDDVKSAMLGVIKGVVDFETIPAWIQVFADEGIVKIGTQSSEKGDTRDWIMNQVVPAMVKEVRLESAFWTQFKLKLEHELGEKLS